MELNCRTIAGSDPRGKPRVFFTCHPDDFEPFFKELSDDILKHANCAVYFPENPSDMYEEGETEVILDQMQLVVIAVTSRFLHEENRARDIDLPYALEHNIPLLPVMLEDDLENEFNNNYAIQFVRKKVTSPAAVPYDEVQKAFLDAALIENEMAEKVRTAFDAYVFLSYRRNDKTEALRLRHLIHENKEFRDISVWFDDYLVPGERFYDAIMAAMDKSAIFTMVVTKELETKGNFVMTEEYPKARSRKDKTGAYPVVPVEMYDRDHPAKRVNPENLKNKEFEFDEIEDLEDEHRKNQLRKTYLNALEHAAKNENDGSAQHRFFIGLAYLHSIDMEYNPQLALKLITSAAEDQKPCIDAIEKLVDMYERGFGVRADSLKAVQWQEKLCDTYLSEYERDHDPDHHKGYGTLYFKALSRLSGLQKDAGDLKAAVTSAENALAFSEKLIEETGIREQERDNALILNHLGTLYNDLNETKKAKKCWKTAAEIYEKLSAEITTFRARHDLAAGCIHLGDMARSEKNYGEAAKYYDKAKDILVQLNEDDPSPERRRDISAILTKLGNLGKSQSDRKAALRYYEEALAMDEMLLKELRTPQAQDDLAVSKVKIGDVYVMEADDTQASDWYMQALAGFRENLKVTDAWLYRDHYASCCEKLAAVRKMQGNTEQAAELYEEAVATRQKLYLASGLDEDGWALLQTYVNSHEFTSGSISKTAVKEDLSTYRESMRKAGSLMDSRQTPISTERIRKGDTVLNTYTVVSDAYSGRMGDVWKVHHNDWDIDLAMKRPQPAYFTECSDEVRADFIRECENWIALGMHPNIVSCYYVREVGGVPSIFSEWMEKGSLNDWINDRTLYKGTPEEVQERILDIAIQMAAGLGYSHRCGIMHQDVKPENIMMSGDTEAKAADFGLAKAQSQLADSASFGYSEKYCPREQMEGSEASPWMDIYAWALTVLYMYAGYPLWQTGAQAKEEMEQYRDRCYVSVQEDVWQLLSSCIKEKRSDFGQVEKELKEIYAKLFEKQYPRPEAETVVSDADALNNLALSYADLGMKEDAVRCWLAALQADPSHPDSIISYGLYLWRNAVITDRDMEKRIHRVGDLYQIRRDEEGMQKYGEMLQQFDAETSMSYLTAYGIPLDIRENIIFGKDPGQRKTRSCINHARLDGDVISFDMHEERDGTIAHVVRSYRVTDGEFIGEQDGDTMPKAVWGPVPEKEEGNEKDYLFCMQDTDLGDYGWSRAEGRLMLVKEPGSRRTLCSVEIRECGSWREKIYPWDEYIHKVYPQMFADHENRRLVFVPLNSSMVHPCWAVYEMPHLSRNPSRMPACLSVPESYKELAGNESLRKELRERFAQAERNADLDAMIDAYDRTWLLPAAQDHESLLQMNAKLMNESRLPGVFRIDEWQESRIYENENGDPHPVGIHGVFRCTPSEDDPAINQLEGLQDGAVHDTGRMTFRYVPWADEPGQQPHGLRIFCYDRQADTTVSRYVGYDLKDTHISRILAIGNEGNTLLLELREDDHRLSHRQASDKGSYTIAWADRRGHIIKEVFHGTGRNPYQAQLIEKDSNIGPFRIYLFEAGNPYHLYCEPEYDDECVECSGIDLYCMHEGASYRDTVHLPDALVPDPYDYDQKVSRQKLEKVLISGFGNGMIVQSSEENQLGKRTNLWVYSAARRQWMQFEGVLRRKGKILVSSDLRWILTGVPDENGTSWSWELYTSKPERENWDIDGVKYSKKRPLWTFEEYHPETCIASFSSDRCYLLDEKGKPVYALCWKYGRQEEYPDQSLYW